MKRVQEFVATVFVIIVVFTIGMFIAQNFSSEGITGNAVNVCGDGICEAASVGGTETPTSCIADCGCTETDPNRNYLIQGSTTGYIGDNSPDEYGTRSDYCLNSTALNEAYCGVSPVWLKREVVDCTGLGEGHVCSGGKCVSPTAISCNIVTPSQNVTKDGTASQTITFNYTGDAAGYELAVGSGNQSGFWDEELCRFSSSLDVSGLKSHVCSWADKPSRKNGITVFVNSSAYNPSGDIEAQKGVTWATCGGTEPTVEVVGDYNKTGIGSSNVSSYDSLQKKITTRFNVVPNMIPAGTFGSDSDYKIVFTNIGKITAPASGLEFVIQSAQDGGTSDILYLTASVPSSSLPGFNDPFDLYIVEGQDPLLPDPVGTFGCSILQPNVTLNKTFSSSVSVTFNHTNNFNAKNYSARLFKENSTTEVVLCNRAANVTSLQTNISCSWTSSVKNISAGYYDLVVNVSNSSGYSTICVNGGNLVRLLLDSTTGTTNLCGNNLIDSGEDCDGLNLGSSVCETVGNYVGGVLACTGLCRFDKVGCVADTSLVSNTPTGSDDVDGETSSVWLWVSLGIIFVLIVGAVLFFFLRAKKKLSGTAQPAPVASQTRPGPGTGTMQVARRPPAVRGQVQTPQKRFVQQQGRWKGNGL